MASRRDLNVGKGLLVDTLISISLLVNIVVLAPILLLMAINSPRVDSAWGVLTPARGILMSIYFAIFVMSVFLMVTPMPTLVFALLVVQVIYKVTTPLTVRSITNPIVISNLAIATVHVFTLVSIFPSIEGHLGD